MQMLFQSEMSPQDAKKLEENFWKAAKSSNTTRAFANSLFEGAANEIAGLDELITKNMDEAKWRIERLAAIDRAILRLGIYELRKGETPHQVVINESVQLAKRYSSEEASAFVNGILDAVQKSLVEAGKK
jgi:N utilization substance protein B